MNKDEKCNTGISGCGIIIVSYNLLAPRYIRYYTNYFICTHLTFPYEEGTIFIPNLQLGRKRLTKTVTSQGHTVRSSKAGPEPR